MWSEECLPFRRIWVLCWGSCCSILSFLCCVLHISVCPFLLFEPCYCLSFINIRLLISLLVFSNFLGSIQIPLQIKHIQVNHGLMIITNLSSKMVKMMGKYSGSVLHRKIEQFFKRQQQLCGHSMIWHCHHRRCNSYIDRMVSVS